jgi:hypothetical protein
MADEPFYAPNHTPTPTARETPVREPVWTLHKAAKRVDCAIRFHGGRTDGNASACTRMSWSTAGGACRRMAR